MAQNFNSSSNPFTNPNYSMQYGPPSGPPPGQQYHPPPGPPPQNYQQYAPPPGPPPGQFAQAPQQPYYQQPPQQYPPQQAYPPQQPQPYAPYAQPGSGPIPGGYDPQADAAEIVKATKGFGTDEKALIRVLARKTPAQIDALKVAFEHIRGKSLRQIIEKETSGNFRDGLVQIVMGPLGSDVDNVHRAIDGAGTNESMLNDVLLARTNADMNMLKGMYRQRYGRPLEKDVADDLSLKTEKLFAMVTSATRMEEWIPVDPAKVATDTQDLYRATVGRVGADEILVCSILANRSDAHIREIANQFYLQYKKKLVAVIESEFSGHMKKALLYIVKIAVNRPTCCAEMLEECMAGMGTRDKLLVERLVRYHWDPVLLEDIKRAYRSIYKKELSSRVKGETSGDYQRLMLAMIG